MPPDKNEKTNGPIVIVQARRVVDERRSRRVAEILLRILDRDPPTGGAA